MPTLLKLFGNNRQPIAEDRSHRIRGLVALLGGLAMGCTVAPVNAWWLAWVALAPLWVMMRGGDRASTPDPSQFPLLGGTVEWGDSRRDRFANRVLLPILWGMGYHGLALSWIVDLHPLTWMGIPWLGSVAIALFAWVFITLWGAAIPFTWSLGFSLATRLFRPTLQSAHPPIRPLPRILTGTALWCATETLWSHSPLYWTSLALTQSPHNLPILHLGQLSGPTAVTAAIVAVNGLLAESFLAWRNRPQQVSAAPERDSRSDPYGNRPVPGFRARAGRYLALALALLAATHLGGWMLLRQPLADRPDQMLTVGLVQGNVPTRIKLFEEGERLALERYTQGYHTLADAGVDLVVMPEGAFPWVWVGTAQQARHPLYQAVLARGVPAIVGTVGWQERRMTQSLFALAPNGEIAGHYDKVKLVPLGEYIPFEAVLGRVVGRLSLIEDSMHPGHFEQRFDTPVGRAIAAICYESAFSYLFRQQAAAGGEFILTASNNDPYPRRMMLQHHAQDVMRAIEGDRWAVRVTNTGLSGIVNPHGETVWLSGYQTLETYAAPIYRRQTKTLYVRWGDWLLGLLLGLSAIREAIPVGIAVIASWLRRSRNSPKSPPS
ncbi:apolipoprotein N-acyltransferase [Thermoleptolyngbya sp. C42_A2020_037]|uniref:apolipoprotein N-acyltransferase n=1 Tax=Thermoleptolyngbya sp. C42_A2020_037 TaxID=2747799 RepID=UPI0019FD706E|nr:apolipoprotein N-acyltransferase [Thermoleptolyngbya sp. C42_A2020_037]MBF2085392.1 apolipoprotein N-acyltransferase [Thermoleptolyngbya sp. C42_A2020_037]